MWEVLRQTLRAAQPLKAENSERAVLYQQPTRTAAISPHNSENCSALIRLIRDRRFRLVILRHRRSLARGISQRQAPIGVLAGNLQIPRRGTPRARAKSRDAAGCMGPTSRTIRDDFAFQRKWSLATAPNISVNYEDDPGHASNSVSSPAILQRGARKDRVSTARLIWRGRFAVLQGDFPDGSKRNVWRLL